MRPPSKGGLPPRLSRAALRLLTELTELIGARNETLASLDPEEANKLKSKQIVEQNVTPPRRSAPPGVHHSPPHGVNHSTGLKRKVAAKELQKKKESEARFAGQAICLAVPSLEEMEKEVSETGQEISTEGDGEGWGSSFSFSFSFSSSSSSAPQGYYSFSPLINCWSTLTETNWTNEGQLGSFLEALHLFRQSCSDENCDIVLLDPGLVTSVEVIPQIAPAIWKKYARGRAAVPLSGSRGRRIEFFGILGMGNSHWVTLMLQRLLMKGEGGEPDEVVLRAVILDPQERSHLSFPPRYRFEKMELEKRKIKCEHLVGLMKEELKKEWGSRFDLPLMLTYLPVGVQPLDDSRNCEEEEEELAPPPLTATATAVTALIAPAAC
uniref:Uncharacterized protein n=1 Tax=Chromera velia CCMP2878 TaxID=1169474 RepID=A0A0G4FMW9_9ALVE|eukprot:Cvel_17727.t1-p1 / transcript=Cvel_17727.t1 / gene=Cvel_17727 / organism=Chromera_velia_CCMP2878 / gene_product=hypothetical protein / transcript_product=hypothetical protein / location=Cvel_scaffold1432:333-2581(-) / protein_length=380 / sequence_SO=supercontig / SO=protein_coding / is_pseudo=false